MDPAAGRTHIPPPGIKRPVDSYHRQLHETHGVQIVPPSDDNTGSGTGGDRSSGLQPRRDSWRDRIASSSYGAASPFSHVASFFDSERLARSAVQSEGTYTAQGPNRMRWPFLGSIRSQRSSPASPTSPPQAQGLGSDAGDQPNEIKLPWRPLFLHRRILLIFAVLFAALIGGLEAVLAISGQNDGLRKADQVSRFVWQYGVVLVFVVVAAFWARVEHQAATAAPWMRMINAPTEIDKSLLLDYVSKFPPWAMITAAKNRDWLVASVFAVGLLLKFVIIFSTALITPLVVMAANHDAKITVEAQFSQSNTGLQNVGSLPYFAMVGLQENNMSFPNGVAARAAYLPFSSDGDDLATLNATVEGFSGGMDCETATLTLNRVRYVQGNIRINITAETSNCTTNQAILGTRFLTVSNTTLPRQFLVFQNGSCDGSSSADDQRIVVMAGTVDLDLAAIRKAKQKSSTATINAQLLNSTALICSPKYVITRMDVSKDPQDLISIRAAGGAENTTLGGVHPWDIAQAHFDSYASYEAIDDQSFASVDRFYQEEAVFHANKPIDAALAMRAKESGSPPTLASLEDASTLKQLAEDYFEQYTALVARYSMMDAALTSSTATSTSIQRRLIARSPPTHLMAALLAICLIITVVAVFLTPKEGFLPRDPSAIVDMAAVIAHSHPLVECLRGMGAASEEAIRVRLGGSAYTTGAEGHEKLGDPNLGYFHIFGGKEPPRNAIARRAATTRWRQPVVYHGLIRILYILILASVIIGFEVSLRTSERFDGLRTLVNDDAYIAWTAVPALILLCVASYMSEVDWWTRITAPFGRLRRLGEYRDTIGLNLIDATRSLALWRALRIGELAAVSTITGASLAALFTVASAALFEPVSMDTSTGVVLRTRDFFANSLASSSEDPVCTSCTNDTLAASMILAGDAPYPAFTFEDLNLPSVSIDGQGSLDDKSNISATLTAIRPRMECRLYLANEISTNITLKTSNNVVNPLRIDLNGETCRGGGSRSSSNAIISTAKAAALRDGPQGDNGTFFGVAQSKANSSSQCSDWMYVWGRLADADSDDISVSSINALACNETIDAVETDVNLYGANLRIDSSDPPAPDELSVRGTSVAIPDLDYSSLVNVTHTGLLDAFFATLNASQLAVSEAALGGSTAAAAGEVRSAILGQHGIIRAQSLNFKVRRHLSSAGTFPSVNGQNIVSGVDPSASVSEAVPFVNANSMSLRIRLEQNVVATRILQGIVGAVLLFHLIAWMFTRRNKLPRAPTTIASVAALLVDGNLLRILPRGAQWQPGPEVEQALGESELAERYGMDWTTSRIRKGRDGSRIKIEGGTFGIRAYAPGEWGEQEELEMKPMRPSGRPPERRPHGRSRLGMVRRGTGTISSDSIQRHSVLVGEDQQDQSQDQSQSQSQSQDRTQRESTQTSDGTKEVVKVWWAA
ncbi:hypothetical protein B0T10DRAFT_404810 [Thelonectria olida]|uniref:Uncharacterized protein n=1 Tax=Thelonectria olida TaxID=1576542 RepID=A0A9P8W6D9_9HYPO|nr:hypothetical protein B0T10DRAFT_404810 [Thelonectria olida]